MNLGQGPSKLGAEQVRPGPGLKTNTPYIITRTGTDGPGVGPVLGQDKDSKV